MLLLCKQAHDKRGLAESLHAQIPRARLTACDGAEGAFYLLARLQTDLDAMAVVTRLVREHKVAVIPGNAFGLSADCYLRVAYGALRQEDVAEGMDRLVEGLRQILSA